MTEVYATEKKKKRKNYKKNEVVSRYLAIPAEQKQFQDTSFEFITALDAKWTAVKVDSSESGF